jgi:O-antigen/teichoic acid export membrane protein
MEQTPPSLPEIRSRLFSAFFTLTFRRALLYIINLVVFGIILPNKMGPSVIGIVNIGNFVVLFFSYFSDFGLAASIIQKKDLTQKDLETTFVIQESISIVLSLIVFLAAPWVADYYKIGVEGMWLIRVLGLELSLISLKTLPSVLLERNLLFNKLVIVEVMETAVYCGIVVALAFLNFGVAAFTWAVLFRGFTGTGLIYILAPWKIRIGFSKESAKTLFKFGVPFQSISLLALVKDRLVDLVVAGIIGSSGVGYVSWAQGWAYTPLEIMNIMSRVTFPAFSRLQDNKEELAKALSVSLFFTALLAYPMLFGLFAVAPSMVKYLLHSDWLPALPLIYLFGINTFWALLSSSFTSVFNAIGKVGITLKLMVMWTILTWALSPFFAIHYGFLGVGLASAIISFSSIVTVILLKKNIKIDIIKTIWKPLASSIVMALVTFEFASFFVKDFLTFCITVALGGLIYVGLIATIARKDILLELRELRHA